MNYRNFIMPTEEIWKCMKEVFCNGLYVISDQHPCGWDFIAFDNLEIQDPISINDISYGNYDSHPLEGLNFVEMLEKVEKFWFEKGHIDDFNNFYRADIFKKVK